MILTVAPSAVAQAKKGGSRKAPPKQKVALCHVNKGKRTTIRVNDSAVSGHLAHGDTQGTCRLGQ